MDKELEAVFDRIIEIGDNEPEKHTEEINKIMKIKRKYYEQGKRKQFINMVRDDKKWKEVARICAYLALKTSSHCRTIEDFELIEERIMKTYEDDEKYGKRVAKCVKDLIEFKQGEKLKKSPY